MLFRLFVLFLVLSIVGCASHFPSLKYGERLNMAAYKSHDVLYIEAINLTEDGSVLSSNDDEVLVFLYQLQDGQPMRFILSGQTTFNDNRVSMTSLDVENQGINYLLVILEQDTNRPLNIYEDIIVENIDQMILDSRNKDYTSIETYLGDDDIIAIQKMKYPSEQVYVHYGSHKGDQYEYRSFLKANHRSK